MLYILKILDRQSRTKIIVISSRPCLLHRNLSNLLLVEVKNI